MKDRITRSRQKIRASASLGYCTPLKLFPVKKEKDFKTPIIIQPISISNVAMKEEPDVQDTKYLLSRAIKAGSLNQNKGSLKMESKDDVKTPIQVRDCVFCSAAYACDKKLKIHMQLCHKIKSNGLLPNVNDPDLRCSSCTRSYRTQTAYYDHLRISHNIVNKIQSHDVKSDCHKPATNNPNHCMVCVMTFESQGSYLDHLQVVHNTRTNTTYQETELNKNVQHKSEKYCNLCKATFKSEHGFLLHNILIHRKELKIEIENKQTNNVSETTDMSLQCMQCKKEFNNQSNYNLHVLGNFKKLISTPQAVDPHKNKLPILNVKNHCCPHCQKQFRTRALYLEHVRSNYPKSLMKMAEKNRTVDLQENPKPLLNIETISCPRCYKSNRTRAEYFAHSLHCFGKRVINSRDYERLPDYSEKTRQCIGCKKRFEFLSHYHHHLHKNYAQEVMNIVVSKYKKLHTNTLEIDLENKRCVACGIEFGNLGNYRRHLYHFYPSDAVDTAYGEAIDKHSNIILEVDDKHLRCAGCKKQFACRSTYYDHLINSYLNTIIDSYTK